MALIKQRHLVITSRVRYGNVPGVLYSSGMRDSRGGLKTRKIRTKSESTKLRVGKDRRSLFRIVTAVYPLRNYDIHGDFID